MKQPEPVLTIEVRDEDAPWPRELRIHSPSGAKTVVITDHHGYVITLHDVEVRGDRITCRWIETS